jgi:uncharacterized membrane protein
MGFDIRRLLTHLSQNPASVRRRFTPAVLAEIEAAIQRTEALHGGEVRFVVETDLPIRSLLTGRSSRQRALDLFSQLGVWDTQDNAGVLIYVLYADRAVEIVADRGFNAAVTSQEWAEVSRRMEDAFRRGDWAGGAVSGVEAAATLVARHFPASAQKANELPDRPLLL